MFRPYLGLIGLLLAACSSENPLPSAPTSSLNLHVPSPDWSNQIIYFVFTDRFSNGNPNNDDQGAGEYDPSDPRRYNGGDLQGIIDQLDYIEALGATAVWITPPVANQWWDPRSESGGYHGYWARNPKAVDAHLGTLQTYRQLSHEIHERGMYLIQDIVPNHMGNFFAYDGPYNSGDPTQNFVLNTESVPTAKPELEPFDLNEATNPDHVEEDIYHFTPSITDFSNPVQETTYALNDLDDLNTSNPIVRNALRDAYGFWIREVGIDGVRIDSVKLVELPFWTNFLRRDQLEIPALENVATETGRDGFLTFGEIFELSEPMDDRAEQKIQPFLDPLDAALAFPLYDTVRRVLTEGRPTEELAYRLRRHVDTDLVPNTFLTPTFLDTHNVQRFLGSGTPESLRQGLLLLMSLPGIPVVYQGTEQEFTTPRAPMFDRFDTATGMFTYIQTLSGLRVSNPVLTKGQLTVRRGNEAGPGVLAFTRDFGDNTALVLLNTATHAALLDNLSVPLSRGTEMAYLMGTHSQPTLLVNQDETLLAELPAKSALVFITNGESQAVSAPTVSVAIDPSIEGPEYTEDIVVTGTSTGASRLVLVVDEDLDNAIDVVLAANGTFTTTLALTSFRYGPSRHVITVYEPDANIAAERQLIRVDRPFDEVRFSVEDPTGDDRGPDGTYVYPSDVAFDQQMDITGIEVETGGTLVLQFNMANVTSTWSSESGFEHVCFSVFFDLPNQDGLTVLPQLDASTPTDFDWNVAHFAFGERHTLYTTENANADTQGTRLNTAPTVSVNETADMITFTYDPKDFGITTFEGASVYVTTWDFDEINARFRDLSPEGGPFTVTGPVGSPKIMDSVGPFSVDGP